MELHLKVDERSLYNPLILIRGNYLKRIPSELGLKRNTSLPLGWYQTFMVIMVFQKEPFAI